MRPSALVKPVNMVSIVCWNIAGADVTAKVKRSLLNKLLRVLIVKTSVKSSSTSICRKAADQSILAKQDPTFSFVKMSSGIGNGYWYATKELFNPVRIIFTYMDFSICLLENDNGCRPHRIICWLDFSWLAEGRPILFPLCQEQHKVTGCFSLKTGLTSDFKFSVALTPNLLFKCVSISETERSENVLKTELGGTLKRESLFIQYKPMKLRWECVI